MSKTSNFEFTTRDGVVLRGDLYGSQKPGSAIVIMTAGFPLLKEHFIDGVAEQFQAAGYSVLAFDYRSYGASDGTPRQQTNFYQQAEDYKDAVTAVRALDGIDPEKVVLYGVGHAGAGAIIAASNDPRIASLIIQSPAISGRRDAAWFGQAAIDQAWAAREVAARTGKSGPAYIQAFPASIEEAKGKSDALIRGEGPYQFITDALKRSDAALNRYENRVTLESVLHVTGTEAKDHLYKIEKPTFYVVFEQDPIVGDADLHRAAYETMGPNAEFKVITLGNASTFAEFTTAAAPHEIAFLDKLFR